MAIKYQPSASENVFNPFTSSLSPTEMSFRWLFQSLFMLFVFEMRSQGWQGFVLNFEVLYKNWSCFIKIADGFSGFRPLIFEHLSQKCCFGFENYKLFSSFDFRNQFKILVIDWLSLLLDHDSFTLWSNFRALVNRID